MIFLEIVMCLTFLTLCFVTTKTDLREGYIYNKTLLFFGTLAIVWDIIYYGFLVKDIAVDFLINVAIVVIVSLFLFFSHSFAGGDCKMTIVMALIYPARFYCVYGNTNYTLVISIGIAIFYGYIYLLLSAIVGLVKKKNPMSVTYIKEYLTSFVKSFISAMIYISAINLILNAVGEMGIFVNVWIIRVLCMTVAWMVGKYSFLKKPLIMGCVMVFDVLLSIVLKVIPISINPENYVLVVILLLCQMTIKNNLYETVYIDDLKEGMIVSTISTMMMQGSRVRGLPKISTEDLRDRVTQDEIESIKRWAEGRNVNQITIVKKIPFAIFLFMGFVSYFIVWSVCK